MIIALFVAVLITSNIASSAKIVDLGFSVFGIRLAFDGGTLLFPLAYIIGSILTEVYGFKVARRAIWTGFIILAASALFFSLLGFLPGEALWETYAGSAAYNAILGGMSTGAIVLASLSAYLAGKFLNTIVHSAMKVFMKGGKTLFMLWLRVISSSLVGELLDSFVFVSVATLTGVFPRELFVTLIITNYILKISIEVILSPFVCLVARALKKAEGLDVIDKGIKYNPFGF